MIAKGDISGRPKPVYRFDGGVSLKKQIAFFVAIFLLQAPVALAGPLYRPASFVSRGHFEGDVQGGTVFKTSFEDYDLHRAYADGTEDTVRKGADFKDDRYTFVTVTYGLFDGLNVFVRAGLVDGGTWRDFEAGNNWEGALENQFVWAVGVRGKIREFENGLGFGWAAQYLRYDDRRVDGWRCADTGESARELGWSTDDALDFQQVDVTATAWWALGALTPYAAAGLTYQDVRFSGRWTHESLFYGWIDYDASFRNENILTALAGLEVNLGGNIRAAVQGTFSSGTALTIGIRCAF